MVGVTDKFLELLAAASTETLLTGEGLDIIGPDSFRWVDNGTPKFYVERMEEKINVAGNWDSYHWAQKIIKNDKRFVW
jgi:hypothetical protein